MADNLPFHGADIWTLYELSWLNANGLPQVAVGHVELDYTSVNLIESKSFKLYLNSFNQTRFDSWDAYARHWKTIFAPALKVMSAWRCTALTNWKAADSPL